MTRPTVPNAAANSPTTADGRVEQAQVAALYDTQLSSTLADTVFAWAVAGLFYWQLRDPMVLAWLLLHLLQLLRYPLVRRYHRDPGALQRSAHWARMQVRELLIYSSIWGLAPWMFMPTDNLPWTTLLMLMVMGLSSAGVPSVAPRWASVLAFVLPMTLGLASALAWRADTTHLFLAACVLLYAAATLLFARSQHRLLTETLRARFDKEALAEQLAQQIAITQRASEEKTRFLAAASHDLRQPLHAIALFGAVLERELQQQPTHVHAERLMAAVKAMGTSLDTMLDVSQLDAGVIQAHPGDHPLASVLVALLPVFEPRAEEARLQLRIRASDLWVRSDEVLLFRLLSNLIENAIKYTSHGGVLVSARARGERVWIDVVDTGIGIAPEHQPRVFDEFFQVGNPARDRTRGLGVGLAIVRRIALLLGHTVQVSSRPGRGSRFRVVLPRAPAQASAADRLPNPLEPRTLRRLPARVLLIDDEADITDAARSFMTSWGIGVQTAQDERGAFEAMAQAQRDAQPFNAVVCDFRLAGGADGLALALALRRHSGSGLPVLLITGETAPDRLQRVHESGLPLLFKPVEPQRLIEALAEITATS